jgi:23S rRNA (uridine2552-2'-O)-methyltransferase
LSRSRKRPDHWTRKAKKEGFGARSVYKLEEIDKRFSVVPKGFGCALDLGCAPGSWSRFLRQRMGRRATLVGVDLQPLADYPGQFIHGSALDISEEVLLEALGGAPDLVVSDMAPNTTGARFMDHVRQIELAEMAKARALELLKPGGHFVAKVFEGQEAHAYVQGLRPHFQKVKRVKPEATRKESVEFFVVCVGRSSAD